MSADPYSPCPCGSGKKLKFCCGAHWPEIERIEKLYNAEQDIAALDAIERLEPKLPDHPFVMNMKLDLLASMGRAPEAVVVRDALIEKHPENPFARFHLAGRYSERGEMTEAIATWYRALHDNSNQLPSTALQIGQLIAGRALSRGEFVAGRMMLNFLTAIAREDETLKRSAAAWMAVEMQPLLIRELPPLMPPSANFLHKEEFGKGTTAASQADLPAAERAFASLTPKAIKEPAVWANLAIIRAALADDQGAAEAYAKLADCALTSDEAIEAEAKSLLYRNDLSGDLLEGLLATYEVQDVDAVIGRLNPAPNFASLPPEAYEEEGVPPPRAVFQVLDRPQAKVSPSLTLDDIPRLLGVVLVFGRETDRPARMVVDVIGRERLDRVLEQVRAVAQEPFPAMGEPELSEGMLKDAEALHWRAVLPAGLPPEQSLALQLAWSRHAILEIWPSLNNRFLDKHTPQAVSADPAWHRRLAAAIALLESQFDGTLTYGEFNALREKLGLEPAQPVDPNSVPADQDYRISLLRLARTEAAKFTDAQLLQQFGRARAHGAKGAMLPLGTEGLRRETVDAKSKLYLNVSLSSVVVDTAAALQFNLNAQRLAVQLKQSPAPYMLSELELRIARQEVPHVERLLKTLMSKHGKEPGIAQALSVILQRLGLITTDGRMAAPQESPALVLPGGGEESGKLWTPEGASGGESKSSLWVPGMD